MFIWYHAAGLASRTLPASLCVSFAKSETAPSAGRTLRVFLKPILACWLPTQNCSVNINFLPASAGAFSATLQVADNAPRSPQTLALNGTGVAAVPEVSLSPALPSFPTITQGTAQVLTVISSGTGPLHVSSVSLSDANASEFTFINNCTVPVAPASDCMISLVFNPIGHGQRAAILMITDDAPSSPQTLSLNATSQSCIYGRNRSQWFNDRFCIGWPNRAIPAAANTRGWLQRHNVARLQRCTTWSGVPSSRNCFDRERAGGNFDDHAYDIGNVFVRDAAPAPACSTDADSEEVSRGCYFAADTR